MDWADRSMEEIHNKIKIYRPFNAPHRLENPMGRFMIEAISEVANCSYVLDEINLTVTFIYEKDSK